MAHIKKTTMPKTWPVPRKGRGKRFVAVPSHGAGKGISLLFLLRDVLKIVKTRKEARYMTLNGMVMVNNRIRNDENFPVQVFDVLGLSPRDDSSRKATDDSGEPSGEPDLAKKNYRLEIVNKKFSLVEISEKDAKSKIVKIIGKKILKSEVGSRKSEVGKKGATGGRVQMNLDDGQNFLSKDKFSVGDSVVLDTEKNKVSKVLGLKKGAKIEVVAGKHAGEKGELVGFEELTRGRDYKIKLEDKTVSLPYKIILVIG